MRDPRSHRRIRPILARRRRVRDADRAAAVPGRVHHVGDVCAFQPAPTSGGRAASRLSTQPGRRRHADARKGSRALMAQLKTPTSPLVLSKPQTHTAVAAVPRVRPRARLWWGIGGLGGVAIAAALWWSTPWRAWQVSTLPAPSAPRDTVRVTQPPPSFAVPAPPPRASRRPSRERVPAPPPAAATESAARTAVAQ